MKILQAVLKGVWNVNFVNERAIPRLPPTAVCKKDLEIKSLHDAKKLDWFHEIQNSVDHYVEKFVDCKTKGLISDEDVHYAGNCGSVSFNAQYTLKTAAAKTGKEEDSSVRCKALCHSIMAMVPGESTKVVAHTLIHLNEKKKNAEGEILDSNKFLYHQYSKDFTKKRVLQSEVTETDVPDAILVPSNYASHEDVGIAFRNHYKIPKDKGDVLDFISNLAQVTMTYFREFEGACVVKDFTPLQQSPEGSLMWSYSIECEGNVTYFLMCRAENFQKFVAVQEEKKKMKELQKIQQTGEVTLAADGGGKGGQLLQRDDGVEDRFIHATKHNHSHKGKETFQLPGPATAPRIKLSTTFPDVSDRCNIVHANKMSKEICETLKLYVASKNARKRAEDALNELNKEHFVRNVQDVLLEGEDKKDVVVPRDKVKSSWVFAVKTNASAESVGGGGSIQFVVRDDGFSKARLSDAEDFQEDRYFAYHALLQCLYHHSQMPEKSALKRQWSVDAVNRGILAIAGGEFVKLKEAEHPHGEYYLSSQVEFNECTVKIMRMDFHVKDVLKHQTWSQHRAALRVRDICNMPWVCKVVVEFPKDDGRHASGFEVVVQIVAAGTKKICVEKHVTAPKLRKGEKPPEQQTKVNKAYVHVPHGWEEYSSARDIMKRVAQMQIQSLRNMYGLPTARGSSVTFCNVQVARLSFGCERCILAHVKVHWEIPLQGKVTLGTKYAVTMSDTSHHGRFLHGTMKQRDAAWDMHDSWCKEKGLQLVVMKGIKEVPRPSNRGDELLVTEEESKSHLKTYQAKNFKQRVFNGLQMMEASSLGSSISCDKASNFRFF